MSMLVWRLPRWLHQVVYQLTGWVLVWEDYPSGEIELHWERDYRPRRRVEL